MERKTIVCLANSRKLGAYCVAGVELDSRAWIRPIGSGDHGAVTRAEQLLEDGSRPETLELIEIPLLRPQPEAGQPENWLIAEGQWRSTGHLDDTDARELLVGDSSSAGPVTAAGNDVLKGFDGDDTLFGDNTDFAIETTFGTVGGEDRLKGGTGDDTLRAGPADDHLHGGADTDDCDGEAGTDDKATLCEVLAGIP